MEALKKRTDEFNKEHPTCYGLAANQIGMDAAVAYARIPDSTINGIDAVIPEEEEIILINPEIIKTGNKIINPNEGCMSFPGHRTSTKRFDSVTIKNYDGEKTYTGLRALIVQHEVDHLNGLTIFDKAINPYPSLGRNEKCGCGSGMKYKYCCAQWK